MYVGYPDSNYFLKDVRVIWMTPSGISRTSFYFHKNPSGSVNERLSQDDGNYPV